MRYDNLPIFKSAMRLCVYVEIIVKSFDKYHKYTIGVDLREYSKKNLFLIHRANISYSKNKLLQELVDNCENFKMLVYLSKELKAFKSFKQFENISKLTVDVCRQAQAWLNSARVVK